MRYDVITVDFIRVCLYNIRSRNTLKTTGIFNLQSELRLVNKNFFVCFLYVTTAIAFKVYATQRGRLRIVTAWVKC